MVADLFQVHVPVSELLLRGTLVYWLLFLIFRFVLRREFISMQELQAKLREQGVDDIRQVAAAYLEGDGQISVIRSSGSTGARSASRHFPGR